MGEYLHRAEAAGLSWPLPEDLSDEELEQLLFPPAPGKGEPPRPMPDWPSAAKELSRKGVTLLLLWQEYKAAFPDGYGYSRYAGMYRAWKNKTDLRMLQRHKAGEKLFVDFAGLTMPVSDPETGEIRQVQIFSSAMGASQRIFARAYTSQTLENWLSANADAFEFYGALPEILVPYNLKAGVTRADRFEPVLNPAFAEFARHYGIAVIPARPRKPRDKAKVENAVQQVERWILAPLRNRTFFSIDELNEEIALKVQELDARLMKGPGASRRELFEELDAPAMRALSMERYRFASWRRAKVAPDYHVEFEGHRYSVPYHLVATHIELRVSPQTLEVFHSGKRVCTHARSLSRRGFTTELSHMPIAHREYAQWTPERLTNWAQIAGPSTKAFVEQMLAARVHPQQAFRSCIGIISLAKTYSPQRLENACARTLRFQAIGYRSVKTILEKGLDIEQETPREPSSTPMHANVRGAGYYATGESCAN